MIIKKDELEAFKKMIQELSTPQKSYSLGKIASNHTSGKPQIVFDGETVASIKRYPYLSSYTPVANDRVLLANVGGSHVVLGKIVS
jgi:hypothetical protein